MTSRHPAAPAGISSVRGPVTALRTTSAPAVVAILWQGGILMRNRGWFLEYHRVGAIAVQVLTGLVVVSAFLSRQVASR